MSDSRLADVLQTQGEQQAMLVAQLQKDMELQRMAVGALLERGDARSWSLVQQVHLVETQLAKLTIIEMDRRKLEMDEHLVSDTSNFVFVNFMFFVIFVFLHVFTYVIFLCRMI